MQFLQTLKNNLIKNLLNIFLRYKSLPIPQTFVYISSVKKKVLLPNKIPIRTQQIIYSRKRRLDVEGMDYLVVS